MIETPMSVRILIVEDDPVSQELIAALLASRGYEVDAVGDGFGALRMAREKPYDLVFVDYHLPEMDGYALARLMRSLGETSERPLKMVAITADRFGLAARRGVDSIFDRILAKPIEPEALFAFVEEALADLADRSYAPAVPAGFGDASDASTPDRPRVAIVPAPSVLERASLAQWFEIVEPDAADGLVLLDASGLAAIEAVRIKGKSYLQALLVVDPALASGADALLDVGDRASWAAAASVLRAFAERRAALHAGIAAAPDLETRIAAFLHVCGRPFSFGRDAAGRTLMTYAGGFPAGVLIDAVKRLAAAGNVSARLELSPGGDQRDLVVTLTAKGTGAVAADAARARAL